MDLDTAILHAARWVDANLTGQPGFRGALGHGSVLDLPPGATLPYGSDLDVLVLFDTPPPGFHGGKHHVDGVLLDIGIVPWEMVADPDALLANHVLAPSFRDPIILADPAGHLAALRDAVAPRFDRREWVERRVHSAASKVEAFLGGITADATLAANAMSLLFGAGVCTHVLLVAARRNPTVRRRYVAVRELLDELGRHDTYPELLDLLGSRHTTAADATACLDALAPAVAAAAAVQRTPVPFASDLAPEARGIALDGSRAMIATGDHREAMFWIAVTWTRCMVILEQDAPEQAEHHRAAFGQVLAALGIPDLPAIQHRAATIRTALPDLVNATTTIIDRTTPTS